MHTLDGLKEKARTCKTEMVPFPYVAFVTASQRVPGCTVRIEQTTITALYDRAADSYLWIMEGRFVNEEQVQIFLNE